MSKLEDLKQMISGLFKDATDKNTIDKAAQLNTLVGEVEQEQKSLTDRNAELLTSYKDLVMHTSVDTRGKLDIKNGRTQDTTDINPGAPLDLDSVFSAANLEKFLQNEKANGGK